jgi:transposase
MATSGLELSEAEREELERRVRLRAGRAEDARRARMILAIDRGDSYTEIAEVLACNRNYISRWKERFVEDRLAGLYSRNRGRAVSPETPKLEAKILAWTLKRTPRDGSTHWTTRKLAKELSVSHMMVARVWARAGVQPHRLEHYQVSNDPEFEKKAAEIIGLYLQPPEHAAVFCVDEKTAIQALDRTDPVLPLTPGRAERHGFEYYRHAPGRSWARPLGGTPARSSSPSSRRLLLINPGGGRSM